MEGGTNLILGDGKEGSHRERGKGVGGEGGRGGRREVEESVMEDVCHGGGIGGDTARVSGEGGNPRVSPSVAPFGHIPDTGVRIVKEGFEPGVFGIMNGEA